MSEIANKLKLATIVLVVVGIAFIAFSQQQNNAAAQEGSADLKSLFERLDARIDEEPTFSFGIKFAESIFEGGDIVTVGGTGQERITIISEIGDDYVCLSEVAGSFNAYRCVPFTNIVTVNYVSFP